jgi:PAS domain-containing protein
MLEGVDPDWSLAGIERKATYTNLKPGQYRFKVIAANNSGKWNRVGAEIGLTIAPPFWATMWFRGMATVVSTLLLFGIYKIRTRSIRSKNKALKEDLVERHRIEAALRQSETNLRITLDSIGDAVIATDSAGHIVRMNPIAEKLTGWTRTQTMGYPWRKSIGSWIRKHVNPSNVPFAKLFPRDRDTRCEMKREFMETG